MGGGGSSTTTTTPSYIHGILRTPEGQRLWKLAYPLFWSMYHGGKAHPGATYNIPKLDRYTAEMAQAPDFREYTAGGESFGRLYQSMAPSLWDTYESNVENPLINRFASSGSLGSAVAGLSGSAADALASRRASASNDISSQVQQQALQGYQGDMSKYAAENAMNIANMQVKNQAAQNLWNAIIQRNQYPFQVLTGVLGAGMPQPYVAQGTTTSQTSGGK